MHKVKNAFTTILPGTTKVKKPKYSKDKQNNLFDIVNEIANSTQLNYFVIDKLIPRQGNSINNRYLFPQTTSSSMSRNNQETNNQRKSIDSDLIETVTKNNIKRADTTTASSSSVSNEPKGEMWKKCKQKVKDAFTFTTEEPFWVPKKTTPKKKKIKEVYMFDKLIWSKTC